MPDLMDEIVFWSRQLSEHALFLSLGIVDPVLKARAGVSHAQWETFRVELPKLQFIPARDRALLLAFDLRAIKLEVTTKQKAGAWLGWLFPTFVDHTRRELDFFVGKLTGQLTDMNSEMCAWLRFMAEHASFAAHLLDPEEASLVNVASKLTYRFLDIEDGCGKQTLPALIELGTRAGRDLDTYFIKSNIGTPQVKSVIHPVLADHVVREGRRFLQTMEHMMAFTVPE